MRLTYKRGHLNQLSDLYNLDQPKQVLSLIHEMVSTAFHIRQSVGNRTFAASHSRGKEPRCWRAKVALGQDKQRKLPFQIMYVFCLSCPSATFVLQRGGFVPHEWLAAMDLFLID